MNHRAVKAGGGVSDIAVMPIGWRNFKKVGSAAALSTAGLALVASAAPQTMASAQAVHAASVTLQPRWSFALNDAGGPIAGSSQTVGTLDGAGPAVIVGDRAGHVYAWHLSDGSPVPGWPYNTGGAGVDSAASVNGSNVYVGVGTPASPFAGGYLALSGNGRQEWSRAVPAYWGVTSPTAGVDSSLSVGTLQGVTAVVGGSMWQMQAAMNAASGAVLPGFPWFEADSNFTTPALADVYRNGQTEIVEGGDSTYGNAFNYQYYNGGHIRVLSPTGNLLCMYNTDQVVQSSPAVGVFLPGQAVGIVAGTGHFYSGASDTNKLIAVNSHCGLAWKATLDGWTNSSPALVDALGNGSLQVAEATDNGSNGGSVWLLNGATGQAIWRVPALGRVIGGVVSVDLGGGYQDILAASTGGLQILDGRTGATLATLTNVMGMQNYPLVTADPNGTVGITIAGYNMYNQGVVAHYEVTGSSGSRVGEARGWPMFHHDPHLSGNAGTPPPVTAIPCSKPATTPYGYYLAAANGAVFRYGNLPYCGSTASIYLDHPMVAMTATRDGGGYWMVQSNGAVYTFGDAKYHGGAQGLNLARPVLAMTSTPDDGGYWLVAGDGGIFSYGDARFYGSTGNLRLNQPIVGMSSTPDGRGYWLVAADGGIFTFGDARFYGSAGALHLAQSVIGMSARN